MYFRPKYFNPPIQVQDPSGILQPVASLGGVVVNLTERLTTARGINQESVIVLSSDDEVCNSVVTAKKVKVVKAKNALYPPPPLSQVL